MVVHWTWFNIVQTLCNHFQSPLEALPLKLMIEINSYFIRQSQDFLQRCSVLDSHILLRGSSQFSPGVLKLETFQKSFVIFCVCWSYAFQSNRKLLLMNLFMVYKDYFSKRNKSNFRSLKRIQKVLCPNPISSLFFPQKMVQIHRRHHA